MTEEVGVEENQVFPYPLIVQKFTQRLVKPDGEM
jgi:hypothetical protein